MNRGISFLKNVFPEYAEVVESNFAEHAKLAESCYSKRDFLEFEKSLEKYVDFAEKGRRAKIEKSAKDNRESEFSVFCNMVFSGYMIEDGILNLLNKRNELFPESLKCCKAELNAPRKILSKGNSELDIVLDKGSHTERKLEIKVKRALESNNPIKAAFLERMENSPSSMIMWVILKPNARYKIITREHLGMFGPRIYKRDLRSYVRYMRRGDLDGRNWRWELFPTY